MAAQIGTDNLQYKSLITAFLYFIPINTLKSRIISTISIARVNLQSISNRFSQTGYQNCECQLISSNTLSPLRHYRVRKTLIFFRGFFYIFEWEDYPPLRG